MQKISKLRFVDASYFFDHDDLLPDTLSIHEAYGYLEERDNLLVLKFIERLESTYHEDGTIVKGLLIPSNALLSAQKNFSYKFNNVTPGLEVGITWVDIVHIANVNRKDLSTMYTEGTIEKVTDTYVVLKDPETLQISPKPIHNHPKVKPARYMIPLSLIEKIEVFK